MQQPPWVFAYASARGNSHIADDTPCQDCCGIFNETSFTIAVVCDGAGSCQNSDLGSKYVTDACLYRFKELVKSNKWHLSTKLPEDHEWHEQAKRTLADIKSDLENFSIEKQLDFKSLSCTIIVTVAFEHGLLVTHIGDGRAGYCNSDFNWLPTITPFHGELANQTVFITSDIWDSEIIDEFIKSKVVRDNVNAFCLLSDGCEKACFECNLYDSEREIYFDPNRPFALFFNPNLKILRQLYDQGKTQDEVNILWQKFLTDGNNKLKIEPDDKTLILGVRLLAN